MLISKTRILGIILFCLVFMAVESPYVSAGVGGVGGNGGAPGVVGEDGQNGGGGTAQSVAGGGGGGGGGGGANGSSGGAGAGGGLLLKSTSGSISLTGSIDATGGGGSTVNGGTVKIFSTCGTDTSGVTSGRTYVTGSNCPPSSPTLLYPINASNGNTVYTTFQLRSSDPESDYLEYWIDVCADNACSSIIRSICQVNAGTGVPGTCTPSQVGWASQDSQAGAAYKSNSTLTLSTLATLNYQPPLLDANTQYWWRGYAIDPGGSNTWSSASAISTFTTAPTETHVQGNVRFQGNVKL